MDLLNENITHDELKKYLKELYNYASKELNIDVPPRLFLRSDSENAADILGKTGGYDPENEEIHLYITDRHPKDILRSFAHELVHHSQKLLGFDDGLNIELIQQDEAYAQHDEGLREMERDAFERGNMIFRAWTDGKKMERKKTLAEATKEQKKTLSKIKKSVKKSYPEKDSKEADSIAHAIKTNIEKGKVSHGKGKPMSEDETIKTATEQAKQDMQARSGKDVKENKSEVQHPYPQLLEEKPRLMQDAFNKKEDLVYQELVRRFIKK